MAVIHKNITGDEAIHEIMYVQSSDPGAVGANKFWLDTTGGATIQAGAILKQRDGSNTSWTVRLALTGGFPGLVGLANGGTHADLSATGGAHKFLKQTSVGADVTVAAIVAADLPSLASSDFAAICTDETGSGNLVFASAPTLSNPVVGTQTVHDNSTKAASTAYVDTPEQWGTLTDGATITWDVSNTRETKKSVTLGGNRTLSITNAVNGSAGILRVTQDGTGSRGLTLPSGSKIVGGGGTTAPLSTAASTVDILAFEYDGTNYWWTIGKAAA